jgi:hypothetical protein
MRLNRDVAIALIADKVHVIPRQRKKHRVPDLDCASPARERIKLTKRGQQRHPCHAASQERQPASGHSDEELLAAIIEQYEAQEALEGIGAVVPFSYKTPSPQSWLDRGQADPFSALPSDLPPEVVSEHLYRSTVTPSSSMRKANAATISLRLACHPCRSN